MFDRRLITDFDWVLLLLVLLAAGLGVLNLYSASAGWGGTPYYLKQSIWLGGGVCIALAVTLFDYRHLEYWALPAFTLTLLLLLAVVFGGKTIMGARRWLDIGPFNLQPSELAKITVVLILARYFTRFGKPAGNTLTDLWPAFLLLGAPVLLIVRQPDLGTALLVVFIACSMILFAGVHIRTLIFLGISGVVMAAGGWFVLHDYQRKRILTFLDPEHDPLGAGYHIIQSKIAVGSGGFFGKGFMQGSQAQLAFLPERHTDFAFSVYAEQWGFAGALLLLLIYLAIVLWGVYVAYRAADTFGRFLAVGITAMLFWHIVVNLGMVIGLLPVVGVPLPLFSYGGTSMITTMIGVGILLNISMRRYIF